MPITLRIAAVLFAVLGFFQCIYDFTHDLRYPPEGWKMVVASLVLAALASGINRLDGTIPQPENSTDQMPKKEPDLVFWVGMSISSTVIVAVIIAVFVHSYK